MLQRIVSYFTDLLKSAHKHTYNRKTKLSWEKYTDETWYAAIRTIEAQKRLSLALPDALSLATDADEILLRYGDTVYDNVYKRDGTSRMLVELILSYVLSGGLDVTSNYPGLVEAIHSSLGEDFLARLTNSYRWALVRGTSFSELVWEEHKGYIVPSELNLLPQARGFQLDESSQPISVEIPGVSFQDADGETSNAIPLDYLLILRGIELPDTPWGMSIYRPGWGDYYNKRAAKKSAAMFVEKLAIPHLIIRRDKDKDSNPLPVDESEKERMIADIELIEEKLAIAEASGLRIDPLQLSNADTGAIDRIVELFEKRQISSILGTASLVTESKYGTYSQALAQEPVMQIMINSQASNFVSSILDQIYQRAAQFNGITDAKFDIDLKMPDIATQEKLSQYESVYKGGWKISKKAYANVLGLDESDIEAQQKTMTMKKMNKKLAKQDLQIKKASRARRKIAESELAKIHDLIAPYAERLQSLYERQAKWIYGKVGEATPGEPSEEIARLIAETYLCLYGYIFENVDQILTKRFKNNKLKLASSKGIPRYYTIREWSAYDSLAASSMLEQYGLETERLVTQSMNTLHKEVLELGLLKSGKLEDILKKAANNALVGAKTTTTHVLQHAQDVWIMKNLPDGDIVGAEFIAVVDDHTTPNCAHLAGGYYSINDPLFEYLTPPLHFGCRSILSYIDAIEGENITWEPVSFVE